MSNFDSIYIKYRISSVLKVETDIIISITVSPKRMSFDTTDNVCADVLFLSGILCLTSHCVVIYSITVSSLKLTMSLAQIKGRMSKLQIIIIYNNINMRIFQKLIHWNYYYSFEAMFFGFSDHTLYIVKHQHWCIMDIWVKSCRSEEGMWQHGQWLLITIGKVLKLN
jgi:hypothetical protein